MPLKPRNLRGHELNPVFHFQTKKEDTNEFSNSLIKNARKTGCLKLAGRGLNSGMLRSICYVVSYVDGAIDLCNFVRRSSGKSVEYSRGGKRRY